MALHAIVPRLDREGQHPSGSAIEQRASQGSAILWREAPRLKGSLIGSGRVTKAVVTQHRGGLALA